MFKKNIYFIFIFLFLYSCGGNTWDSVKRGVTGQKDQSTDEFLVQKKDPLILPPNFESLPMPETSQLGAEENNSFEESFKKKLPEEDISSAAGSTEENLIKKIRKK